MITFMDDDSGVNLELHRPLTKDLDLSGLLELMTVSDINTELERPGKDTIYLQLEERDGRYYCFWTYNPKAKGDMYHHDCRVFGADTIEQLWALILAHHGIELDKIDIANWHIEEDYPF